MKTVERDRAAYSLAKDYLLTFESRGITAEVLAGYLDPPDPETRHETLTEIFQALVASAQTPGMSATVIGGSIGGVDALGEVLFDFDPRQVQSAYGEDWELLLDAIEERLRPRGKVRREPRSLWPRFCRAALSGAAFLSRFRDGEDFSEWVLVFDADERTRPALPMLLAAEIEGYGFAVACDFLKDIGFLNFCKPDVHVNTIFKGLALVEAEARDYDIFKAMLRVAESNGVTRRHRSFAGR